LENGYFSIVGEKQVYSTPKTPITTLPLKPFPGNNQFSVIVICMGKRVVYFNGKKSQSNSNKVDHFN